MAVMMGILLALPGPGAASDGYPWLTSGFSAGSSAWSPSGETFASPALKAIELRRADGTRGRPIRGRGIGYFGWPCECPLGWSSDQQILFLSRREEVEGSATVGQVDATGEDLRTRSLGVPVGAASWSPDGWPLIFIPNSRAIRIGKGPIGPKPNIWRLDGLDARPRRILSRPGEEDEPVVSPTGDRILYFRIERSSSSLWVTTIDGSGTQRLVGDLLGPSSAAWSPSGDQIALSTFSKHDRRRHIYVVTVSRGAPRQIVREEVESFRAAWTPDGEWITFANWDGEIRATRPNGTGLYTLARLPGEEIDGLGWSPDGQFLGYVSEPVFHDD